MILDRKTPPKIKAAEKYDFLKAATKTCSNGLLIHSINHGEQEVIRLQFVLDAGSVYQSKPLLAAATNQLLLEGTLKRSSQEIANYFENRGAFVQTELEADKGLLNVYCLTKNLAELLPVIHEVLYTANFPEEEVESFRSIQKQNFMVNSQKVSFMAKNSFLTALFGEDNPYASKVVAEDYDKISRDEIVDFYTRYYKNGKLSIFASGKVEAETLDLLERVFGKEERKESIPLKAISSEEPKDGQKEFLLPKANALQSAIRLGKPIISKHHPDFPALFFTNTILGGYFGSRLMSNIREDKGYTYGIGSGLVSYRSAAYFLISTEVGAELTQATLQEIEKEVKLLQTALVGERELSLVKNYLRGSILKNFDGAFAAMDRFRSLETLELDYNYYTQLMSEIQKIEADKVQEMAKKYLEFESFIKIIAGKV